MSVLVIRWLRYPCNSITAELYRHFHRLFRRWKAWCFIWRFNWRGASVCEVSISARPLILFNNYKIILNNYKTVPIVIQLQGTWMWNYVSWWKKLDNVQEMFFNVSGVLVPWVPETFLARFPVSVKSLLRPRAEDVSAFGKHRKFTPHARKTCGTQGRVLDSERFFNELSAHKNSLCSSSKLRKPHSVTSKNRRNNEENDCLLVFCP